MTRETTTDSNGPTTDDPATAGRTRSPDATRSTEAGDEPRTIGEISHANPYTNETAGQLFNRGPIVRADGGRETDRATDGRRSDDDGRTDRMKDVSHTPPKDADDANRVFERGGPETTGHVPVEREE